MANKKKETEVEETQTDATVENTEASEEVSATEEAPKKAKKSAKADDQPSVIDSVIDTVTSAVGSVADAVVNAVGGNSSDNAATEEAKSKRAQRIGVVTSDKMTKTVTVRVDRLIKHPKYRRYVRRKKQFMAHDETGAAIGDKVRIIETRPLSARKRWRVVEIIQKAAK